MAQPMNIKKYYEYIGNDAVKGWLQRGLIERQGVFVPLAYMHMVNSNGNDAILLGQILYWHDISAETNRPRITHWFEGNLWVVHSHEEWAKQTGISARTVRDGLERLANLKLIIKEQHRSTFPEHKGGVVSFVRVNWEVFVPVLTDYVESETTDYVESELTDYVESETTDYVESYTYSPTDSPTENKPLVASATSKPDGALSHGFNHLNQIGATDIAAATVTHNGASHDDKGQTELVAYLYSVNRQRMGKTHLNRLSASGVFQIDGDRVSTASAQDLYVIDPRFKDYVDDMIAACKRLKNGELPWQTLIGLICNFERETPGMQGWIAWKKTVPLVPDKKSVQIRADIEYFDIDLEIPDDMRR